jgi:hypothetical protein
MAVSEKFHIPVYIRLGPEGARCLLIGHLQVDSQHSGAGLLGVKTDELTDLLVDAAADLEERMKARAAEKASNMKGRDES